MGLITLVLVFVIGRYSVVGKVYDYARRILAGGTLLVAIHFMAQYVLHKSNTEDEALIRTFINLFFGIPLSYLFNMSNYYVLRKGKIPWVNWVVAPLILVLSVLSLIVCYFTKQMVLSATLIAIMYAFTLIYYAAICVREYFKNISKIRANEDFSLLPYIKWTRWSLLTMVVVSLGFPFMTFCTNQLYRSLYGLLSISSGFLYALSFMGYGINGMVSSNYVKLHGEIPVNNSRNKKLTMSIRWNSCIRLLILLCLMAVI